MRLNQAFAALLFTLPVMLTATAAMAQPISYQGRVSESGGAPVGDYEIGFQVFDSLFGGSPIGVALERSVTLSEADNGVFAFDDLDFGAGVFGGADRWLEISVKKLSDGGFTTLGPRQAIRPTPYSLFAESSGTTLNDAHLQGNQISNAGGNPFVVAGLTQIGTGSTNGFLQLFMTGTPDRILQFGSVPGFGGQTRWFDEAGTTIGLLEADPGGNGLAMRLSGNGGVLEWDGDLGGMPGSRFFVTGPESGFTFDTSLTGDDAFVLPDNVISMDEIGGEMGLASDAQTAGITLNQNFQTIISRSITVPGPGNVVVLASGSTSVQRLSNSVGLMVLGVSDSPTSLPDTQQMVLQIGPNGISGFYNWPITAHGVFETPVAGTFTFYFNGNSSGFATPRVFDANITLLYIPTAYGDVTPSLLAQDGGYSTDGPTRGGMTEADILQEQLAEQVRAMEALKAEQERMREMIEEMKSRAGDDS
ncbi:MAG: hypothetical protein AB8F26_12570 [Phycisphaerales bacterium]